MKNRFKIIVLGDKNVGKTSLSTRFTTGNFKEEQVMTIGANFALKDYVSPKTGDEYRLSIWDTAGQELYRKIVDGYYEGSTGALIVFDIVNRKSFTELKYWISEVKNKVVGIKLLLVGNKIDLEENREVSHEEAQEFAKKLGIGYLETSAKSNININEAFSSLAELMIVNQVR